MQIKRTSLFMLAFFVFLLPGLKAGSAHQIQVDTLGNNLIDTVMLSVLPDSAQHHLNLENLHVSLRKSSFVIDDPSRQGYIDYKISTLSDNTPTQLLISQEYLKGGLLKDLGIQKQSRPRWVLFTVFVLIFFVGLIRVVFPTEFKIIIEAYYRERLLLQVSKEDNLTTSWPYICLYGVFSLALGLFLVISFSEFNDSILLTPWNFFRASLIIALLFIAKIVISRFISFVFELEKIMREYVAIIYLMYFNSMLVLLPFLLFIVLIPVIYFKILLIIFAISVSILFIYRILRTSIHLFGDTQFSISYLILYLCTLEIAPILLLVRTLGN